MKLFNDFPPISAQEWEQKIIKDLNISSIQELFSHTPEAIVLYPFYTKEHLQDIPTQNLFFHPQYEIVQFIPTQDHSEEELNELILKSLNGGATGIYLNFYQKKNFSEIFNNISLPHIYSNINLSFDAINLIDSLKDIYLSTSQNTQQKNCFINIDPIFLFERFAEWHNNQEDDFEVLFQLNHIPVNATLYKESGADVLQEIAFTIAHLNEYLYYIHNKNKLSQCKYIHINLSVGNSFFTEIAKLRALRILIHHLLKEYKHAAHIHIHAQTTLLNKSYLDIYNNIIRSTSEAMSAIFGGANSISILPYNYPFYKTNEFSLRMARNQLIIMNEESYLNKTSDVSYSCFFIEHYTQILVNKAYQKFLEIEKQNGLISLLEKNTIPFEINNAYQKQLQKYIDNKELLIGVNKYPPSQDKKKSTFFYSTDMTQTGNHSSKKLPLIQKRLAEVFENKFEST